MDDRSRALTLHRRKLLALDPRDRVREILSSPQRAELVRALPAQEFYLTLVEAGLDETLPLLPLASTPQLEFIFDVDCWSKDAFDPARAARWISTLHQASPELTARWLRGADENLVVLTLLRLVHVYKADESADQAYWPPDRPVPTLDGLYYIEAREGAPEDAAAALWEGLARLRAQDRNAYEALLEQTLWAVPPELEEESHQRRSSRLAERGFPEFDEAMSVWAAGPEASPEVRAQLAARLEALPAPPAEPGRELPDRVWAGSATALARAAPALSEEQRERLLSDLVRLGNRYAVADLAPLGEPATHRDALIVATSFVNLGLAELTGGRIEELGAKALSNLSIFELNRAGVGAVLQRAARARRLVERGWLARVHLARERLDDSLRDILEGLLGPRPRFTAAGENRPFRDPADLAAVDEVLSVVAALGEFLEHELNAGPADLPELSPPPLARQTPQDIEWSAVALTTLARAALGAAPRPAPLGVGEARRALDLLLTRDPPRAASARFREWAGSLRLGPAAQHLAAVLERDAGDLPREQAPDPRFVRALLFRGDTKGTG